MIWFSVSDSDWFEKPVFCAGRYRLNSLKSSFSKVAIMIVLSGMLKHTITYYYFDKKVIGFCMLAVEYGYAERVE